MTALLDLYEADAGAPARRVTVGKDGPEYAGPCPSCGGRDRFRVWPEKAGGKVPGRWWCRACNKRGDALAYPQEFRGMTFPDACALLGVDAGRPARVPRSRREPPPAPDPLAARECAPPADLWQTKADELAAWAEAQLWTDAGAGVRAYLAGRGLAEETLRRFRLGWIPAPIFRERVAWGIPEELREDGKPRKLLIPPGVLIPCRDDAGRVVRLRVRYWTREHGSTPPPDPKREGKAPPKYQNVRGSAMRALVCGAGPAAVVVESDLDALLLAQDAGDLMAAVALGSADVRPDPAAAELLRAGPVVLVALDTDEAGGKAAWGKWAHAKNAEVWPVPSKYGKDPGEARASGLNLRAWILAGLRMFGAATTEAGICATSTRAREDQPSTTEHSGATDPAASSGSSGPPRDPESTPAETAARAAAAPPAREEARPFPRVSPALQPPASAPAAVLPGPAAVPTGALCRWLRSLRLPPDPGAGALSPRWTPTRQATAQEPTAPPYCLDLAACLERIAPGKATAADAARALAWIPNGSARALEVCQRDRDRGDELLRELVRVEAACRVVCPAG